MRHLSVAFLVILFLAELGCGKGGSSSINSPSPVSVKSTLVSISVRPASALIAINTNQRFTAIGTYSDGRTRDITSLVTWQSPNSAVAIMRPASNLGVASGIGVGTSTITATMQSITGSSLLTVSSAVVSQIAITPPN